MKWELALHWHLQSHVFFKIALHLLFRQDFGSGQIPVKVDGSEFASEQQVFGCVQGNGQGAAPSVREPGRRGFGL